MYVLIRQFRKEGESFGSHSHRMSFLIHISYVFPYNVLRIPLQYTKLLNYRRRKSQGNLRSSDVSRQILSVGDSFLLF